MKRYFEYNRTADEVFNGIVDSALELARESYEGKKSSDYKAKNKKLVFAMGQKMAEGTMYASKYATEGNAMYKEPMVRKNTSIRENFEAILAQVVGAIVPEVFNEEFSDFIAETHQVGFGDTARFKIESNDLFKVNRKAEGVRKGVDQPMFDDEITVNASPIEISTAIDWYPFAAGEFDMGNFGAKIGRSFAAYIFLKVVKGMTQAATEFGAAYTVNGVTPQLFGTLRDRVRAANGGMEVVAIGTAVALSSVSLQGNYQVEIGEEMNKVGYLDQYLGVPLIGLKNVLVPGTTNGNATLALDDKKIYLVPVAGSRPVKVVFEGNEISISFDTKDTADRRMGLTVELRVGIGLVAGSKYGLINLQ